MAMTSMAIATHGAGEHRNFSEAEPQARFHAALFKRVQIGQHHKGQRHELQQIRIVLEPLEIEDRIERERHHDKERAAAVDHA